MYHAVPAERTVGDRSAHYTTEVRVTRLRDNNRTGSDPPQTAKRGSTYCQYLFARVIAERYHPVRGEPKQTAFLFMLDGLSVTRY